MLTWRELDLSIKIAELFEYCNQQVNSSRPDSPHDTCLSSMPPQPARRALHADPSHASGPIIRNSPTTMCSSTLTSSTIAARREYRGPHGQTLVHDSYPSLRAMCAYVGTYLPLPLAYRRRTRMVPPCGGPRYHLLSTFGVRQRPVCACRGDAGSEVCGSRSPNEEFG